MKILFYLSIVIVLLLPLGTAAQGISQLQQFTATTSPAAAITQTVFGKAFRLSGQASGCAQFSANGTLTSTGITCGSGGTSFSYPFPANATSTNLTFSNGLTGSLTGNASTATALAANGANCAAGNYPLGVNASGAVENCTAAAAGGISDFTFTTNFGQAVAATSSRLWLQGAVTYASTTLQFDQNTLSIPSAVKYIDWQRDAQSVAANGYTLMRIRSPQTNSRESTLTLYNDLNNNNSDINVAFVDFYNENYADSNQSGIRLFSTGTAPQKPFLLGYKTPTGLKDAQNVFGILPTGAVFAATATSTVPADTKLFVASSTAANLLRVDSTPGTNKFLVTSTSIIGEVLATFNQGVAALVQLVIPNGANPTANDPGEIAHDTTGDQLVVDDFVMGSAVQKIWSVTVASTSPAFISAGLLPVPLHIDGYTVTAIRCYVVSGTSKVIAVEDASGNSSEDITCGTAATSDDGSITNATYTAAELSNIDFGATAGAVDYVSIAVFGTITRE